MLVLSEATQDLDVVTLFSFDMFLTYCVMSNYNYYNYNYPTIHMPTVTWTDLLSQRRKIFINLQNNFTQIYLQQRHYCLIWNINVYKVV